MSYTRKRGSGSRDLGLSSNGKGSADRVTDVKAFQANYDEINWGHKKSVDVAVVGQSEPCKIEVITPPSGYRNLVAGEKTQPGDLFHSYVAGNWWPATIFGREPEHYGHFARPIKEGQ